MQSGAVHCDETVMDPGDVRQPFNVGLIRDIVRHMTKISHDPEIVNHLTSWIVDRPRLIGDLMRQAHQRLVSYLDTALREVGYSDVTSAHVSVLATIDAEGCRLTTLVERGGRTKQATAELAAHLLAQDYISIAPDPTDGRAKRYALAKRGWALLADAEKVVTGYEAWLDRMLGRDGIEQLRNTLTTIINDRRQPGE